MSDNNQAYSSHVLDTVDTFMAAVPWTKNRMVIIYQREHAGRKYIRLRTFNRHQVKGVWYPTKRFFMVPMQSATILGNAILEVAKGNPLGNRPSWWDKFEEQYSAYSSRREMEDIAE